VKKKNKTSFLKRILRNKPKGGREFLGILQAVTADPEHPNLGSAKQPLLVATSKTPVALSLSRHVLAATELLKKDYG